MTDGDLFAVDPREFLTNLKVEGGRWSAMNAARLVMGPRLADNIRADMGDHWLTVVMAAHLDAYPEHRSFAHSTLRSWLDYQADRIDDAEYHQRLVEHMEDGKRDFLRTN